MNNIKNILLACFVISLIAFVVGCGLLQQSSGGGGRSYFPNTDSYSWRYSSTDGSSSISTVEGTRQIGSATVQVVKSRYTSASGTVSTGETYWRVEDAGVYIYPSVSTTESMTFLAFPLEVGKTWKTYDYGTSEYSSTASVAARENVTVSAGTFDCYKVGYVTKRGTVELSSSNIWFGDGAGMVKVTSSGSTIESQLAWKSF